MELPVLAHPLIATEQATMSATGIRFHFCARKDI